MNTIEVTVYIEDVSSQIEKDKRTPHCNVEVKFVTTTSNLENDLVRVLRDVERAKIVLDP